MQISNIAHNRLLQLDHTLQSIITNPKQHISHELLPVIESAKCLKPKQVISVASTIFYDLLSYSTTTDTQAILKGFSNHLRSYVQIKDHTAMKSNSILRSLLNRIERCTKAQHIAEEFEFIRIEILSREDASQNLIFPHLFQGAAYLYIEKCIVEKMITIASLHRQKEIIKRSLFEMGAEFEYYSPFKARIQIPEKVFNTSLLDNIILLDALHVSVKMCFTLLTYESELFRNTYKSLLNEASLSPEKHPIQLAKLLLEYRELEMRLYNYQREFYTSPLFSFATSHIKKPGVSKNLIRQGLELTKAFYDLCDEHQKAHKEFELETKYKSTEVKKKLTLSNVREYAPIIEKFRSAAEVYERKFYERIQNFINEYYALIDKKVSTYDLIISSFLKQKINLKTLIKAKAEYAPQEFNQIFEKGFSSSISDAKKITSSISKNIVCVTDELQYDHNFHKLEVLSLSQNNHKPHFQSTKRSTVHQKNAPSEATDFILPKNEEKPTILDITHVKPTSNEASTGNKLLTPIQEPFELVCAWHVSRWFTPEYNPFIEDLNYSRQHVDPLCQRTIRIQHSFPLAFAEYVKQKGFQSEYKDPYTKITYDTFTVGAEYEIRGSTPVQGKLTLGFSKNGVLCHNFFTTHSSTSYIAEYVTNGKLNHDKEELDKLSLNQQATAINLNVKLLDDSYITMKTPLTVTERFVTADIEVPLLGKITFRIFFLLGASQLQLDSLDHIPNGTFIYQHN